MQRRLLCEAVRTVLTCAASREPLIVACEDLHWADASSLELWAHLLPLTAGAAVALGHLPFGGRGSCPAFAQPGSHGCRRQHDRTAIPVCRAM